jgi:hypothetical protein
MQPDRIYRVRIKISGFTQTQVEQRLPDLREEIGKRPWILDSQAFWDRSINKLVIMVGYEFQERLEDRAFDELSDCVIATLDFDEKIAFDMERI